MQANNVSVSKDSAECPRLFSVLGGAVTRAALMQVQRNVDTLVEVSHAAAPPRTMTTTTNVSAQNHAGGGSAPPLRRVLEVLRATAADVAAVSADLTGQDSATSVEVSNTTTTTTTARGARLTSSTPASPQAAHLSDSQMRDALIHALGVTTGSALFRECVAAPRRRMHEMVEHLAQAVRRRYLPSLMALSKDSDTTEEPHILQHPFLLSPGESIDVHVQLYPSRVEAGISAVPAALRAHRGFCAAVTIRRLSALEDEAAAGQRLLTRYMSVAAPGQTLATALDFWSDVSYGDAPPPELSNYPPLGFEPEAALSSRGGGGRLLNGSAPLATSPERQPGRKAPRAGLPATALTSALEDGAQEDATTIFLGLPEGPQKPSAQLGKPPRLTQPAFLVCPDVDISKEEEVSTNRSGSGALHGALRNSNVNGDGGGAHVPHVTYPSSGIIAVLYVHCSGVAYVGYPAPLSSAPIKLEALKEEEGGEEALNANAVEKVDSAVDASAASSSPVKDNMIAAHEQRVVVAQPRVCVLPMLSSTGFTRSLLGLM